MKTTRRFSTQSKIPFAAALFAAFCLLFLPGYGKTPEEHARIASDPSVDTVVEALAAANEQIIPLVRVVADSHVPDVKCAAASKLNDPRAIVAFAKKVHQTDGTGAELAAEVMPEKLAKNNLRPRRTHAIRGTRLYI
ncbi:MAG: hypothetical protein LBS59_09300 [Puniceicoccales bacterium]|jgi:hypothetical protein|nr:hypothetical protein [Puniceicoccales bacterium]